MSLDSRLRAEFQRTASGADTTPATDVLAEIVHRAGSIRRRRRIAGAAVAATGLLVTAALMSFPALHLGVGDREPPAISPSPAVTPSPLHQPLTEPFTSQVHGYSASYPTDWTAAAARKVGQPDWFRSAKPGTSAITVTSRAIPAGVSEDEWVSSYLPDDSKWPECWPPPEEWDPITVDGHPGGMFGGMFQCQFTQAIVVADGRAYIFNAMPDPDAYTPDLFDRGLFNDFLATVRLTPSTAK